MSYCDKVIDLLNRSYSPFHVVRNLKELLLEKGYEELEEKDPYLLKEGESYFVTRNDSALIAFSVPKNPRSSAFRISASHTDSPTFKIKPNPVVSYKNLISLNVEPYGVLMHAPWLDRPLSFGGRVYYLDSEGRTQCELVAVDEDLLVIPNLCIHFNREKKQYHLTVFSIFDPALSSRNDETTEYFYIRNNPILSFFDRCISLFQRVFLKKKNATTFKNLLYRYRYFLGVKKALEEQDFDLVILENHCSEFLCLKTKKLQQKYEGKVVFHSHNVPAHYRRVIRWMSCLKTIYSVSQALSSLWERALAESLPHVSFRVLRNGIDTSLFAPKTESDILAQAKSRFHDENEGDFFSH